MKQILTMFLTTLLVNCGQKENSIKTHEVVASDQVIDSTISYKKMRINRVPMGIDKTFFLREFGKPSKTINTNNDFDDSDLVSLYYGGNKFDFHKNKLSGFSIEEKEYSLNSFKIGDKMNYIKNKIALTNKAIIENRVQKFKIKIDNTDSYIIFHFRDSTLIKMETWDDN